MIIGLCGMAGSGKDTVAKILKEYDFQRVSFGDEIRLTCSELFYIPYHFFVDRDKKDKILKDFDKTPTQIMIHVGQSMREIDYDVWVNKVEKHMKNFGNGTNFVITDIRQENEANFVMSNGGIIYRVVRDGVGREGDLKSTGLPEWDLSEIDNNGTIDELKEKVLSLINEIDSSTS